MTTTDGPLYMSLHDETLGVSLEAPVGWARATSDVFPLQLLAPAEDGFRANGNFSHEQFEPPTPEGLATFVTRTKQAQLTDYEGFEELGVEEIVVDNRPGSLQHYAWTPVAMGRTLQQLLVVLVVEPGLLLEIDAATLADRADVYLPIFRRLVTSIRFL
jgi:hypothetical protein